MLADIAHPNMNILSDLSWTFKSVKWCDFKFSFLLWIDKIPEVAKTKVLKPNLIKIKTATPPKTV